jgi:hypothetical protein
VNPLEIKGFKALESHEYFEAANQSLFLNARDQQKSHSAPTLTERPTRD